MELQKIFVIKLLMKEQLKLHALNFMVPTHSVHIVKTILANMNNFGHKIYNVWDMKKQYLTALREYKTSNVTLNKIVLFYIVQMEDLNKKLFTFCMMVKVLYK